MSQFDQYAESYGDVVNQSIAFAGADVDYFAARKAEDLLAMTTRLLDAPERLGALDVGCGVGVTDRFLVDRFGELHGVDVTADSVAQAARNNPDAHYQAYDGARLPFDDATFDVVFAICVAHHVPPMLRHGFSDELARVVRPGGLVALYEHNPLNPLTRVAVSRCEFDEGVVLLSRGDSSRLLEHSGLQVVDRRYIIFTPWEVPRLQRLERHLRAIPLGAQHCVVARKVATP
ncbi:MAG: methyltransferase domain-containing protein [Actinobacteria bacterium]|nr:methyltransferase domain-containing protein [Actinomycetota bacterium]